MRVRLSQLRCVLQAKGLCTDKTENYDTSYRGVH